jgi:WhiB family transcriptional regulator, redox-sensing transcriptional regulator
MSDFRYHAACRDVDPELFFPIGNGPIAQAQSARAKAVCRTCAVIGECLRWAIDSGQAEGVWGGTDAVERRQDRIRRASADRGVRRATAR